MILNTPLNSNNYTSSVLSELVPAAELKIGLQVAGVALIKFDYEANLAILSPEAAIMFGLCRDNLIIPRHYVHATFHPDEANILLEEIERVLDPKGNGWFACDHRVIWPNGEVRWLSVRKQVFFEQSNNTIRPRSGILAAVDITERVRAENDRRESERKFSAIFDQTFELLWLISTDGYIQEVNQSALNSIATRREDIIGKKFWNTPWCEHSHNLQTQLEDAVARSSQGEFVRFEIYFPNREMEIIVTDFSLKPIFNEAGRVTRLIAEGHDITERKKTEAALLESEARFRTLADNISQLVWMADETGWIFWYNQRWLEYTGTTLDEMQGWSWYKVHHPDHVDRVVQRFCHYVVELGEEWEDTFPLRRNDGLYRWFLSLAFPIRDERTGKIVRWFGSCTDITELKSIQEELEKRNEELDNFVHIVSHDLKAPLRGISSLSQWIEEDLQDILNDETRNQTQLLRQRVQRMSQMIDGLLEYAKVGVKDSGVEEVKVEALISEVIDSIAPPDTFQISILSNLPTFRTKKLLLSQVFSNLISNAIKHHDCSNGEVQISHTETGNFYQFEVSDNGPGIPEEYHNKIFTIFQTGVLKKGIDSTGVGLAIVKKIVENQGGSIWLKSPVDQGAVFQFTWPK